MGNLYGTLAPSNDVQPKPIGHTSSTDGASYAGCIHAYVHACVQVKFMKFGLGKMGAGMCYCVNRVLFRLILRL